MAQAVNSGMVQFGSEEDLLNCFQEHEVKAVMPESLKQQHVKIAKIFAGAQMTFDQIEITLSEKLNEIFPIPQGNLQIQAMLRSAQNMSKILWLKMLHDSLD